MIKNALQYRMKKGTLKRFEETLRKYDELIGTQEPWVKGLHQATIQGEIRQLKQEIAHYDRLLSGEVSENGLALVADIPRMLIERRIALGWTQADLAMRLDVTTQQVQADESNDYASANLARLIRTAEILRKARRRPKTSAAELRENSSKRAK